MKVTPPAVAVGPPFDGRPVCCLPLGKLSVTPSTERQTTSPVSTLTAMSSPHRPFWQGERVTGSMNFVEDVDQLPSLPCFNCSIAPSWLLAKMNRLDWGSKVPPAHSVPPCPPGKRTTGRSARSGSNILVPASPPLSTIAWQIAWCSGVLSATSLRSKLMRVRTPGLFGMGCVGQACSPATLDGGTGVSITPWIGSPVTRLSRNSSSVLFITATAGIAWPSL